MNDISSLLKTKCYRRIGECLLKLGSDISLHYFSKYLWVKIKINKYFKASWYINNLKHELIAYDKIGMFYYYKGDLTNVFH